MTALIPFCGGMAFACTVTDGPMGASQVVRQARCAAYIEEEPAPDRELERFMDYDYRR